MSTAVVQVTFQITVLQDGITDAAVREEARERVLEAFPSLETTENVEAEIVGDIP